MRETDPEALALFKVPRSSAVERQRQHVPCRQLNHAICRSSYDAGIVHQQDAKAAHFAWRTCSLIAEPLHQGVLPERADRELSMHTCNSRSSSWSSVSRSFSTRSRVNRASQPASALLARRSTGRMSDESSHSSNIVSMCPGMSSA